MDADKLEELERLLAETTFESGERLVLRLFKPEEDGAEGWLQYAKAGGWRNLWDADGDKPGTISFTDAALIVAAINALPELVARVRELEAERGARRLAASRAPHVPGAEEVEQIRAHHAEFLAAQSDGTLERTMANLALMARSAGYVPTLLRLLDAGRLGDGP